MLTKSVGSFIEEKFVIDYRISFFLFLSSNLLLVVLFSISIYIDIFARKIIVLSHMFYSFHPLVGSSFELKSFERVDTSYVSSISSKKGRRSFSFVLWNDRMIAGYVKSTLILEKKGDNRSIVQTDCRPTEWTVLCTYLLYIHRYSHTRIYKNTHIYKHLYVYIDIWCVCEYVCMCVSILFLFHSTIILWPSHQMRQ